MRNKKIKKVVRIDVDNVAARYLSVFTVRKGKVLNVTKQCYLAEVSPYPLYPQWGKVGLYALNALGNKYLVEGYGGEKEAAKEEFRAIVFWLPNKYWWKQASGRWKAMVRVLQQGMEAV